MMAERDICVDHSTVHRWVIKVVPLFEKPPSNFTR
jgi:transposase-like protein